MRELSDLQPWKKLGRVFVAEGHSEWMHSRAFVPTPWLKDDSTIRVFLAFLDKNLRGRIGYVDVSSEDPLKIQRISQNPCLDLGELGSFDEDGVTPQCVLERGNQLHLYYIGWQRQKDIPYTVFTHLAVSNDGGETFRRISEKPVLGATKAEPFIRTGPHVLTEKGIFRCWYQGLEGWAELNGKRWPKTDLRYVESRDGIHWPEEGRILYQNKKPDRTGVARPNIIRENDKYHMWIAERSTKNVYELRQTHSGDGFFWEELGSIPGLSLSEKGWDSQNNSAPAFLQTSERQFLFYNGNRFGAEGFGVAIKDHGR